MIGVLGDLHLGRSIYQYDLTDDIRRTMWAFHGWCVKRSVHMAVQLGDVFDRPTPAEYHRKIFAQWCNLFERSGIPLIVLAGNHDCMGGRQGSTPTALETFKTLQRSGTSVRIVDRPTVINGYLMLPWPSPVIYPSHDEWLDDVFEVQREAGSWAFAHLHVDGAVLGDQEMIYRGTEYAVPDVEPAHRRIPGVICGHVHRPQRIGKVHVVGAATRLRFDEAEQDRVFCLVDRGRVLFYKHSHSRRLVQIGIDASAWSHGGDAPTTDEVVRDVEGRGVDGAVVKVIPIVDQSSAVDWQRVETAAYQLGAVHVHVAPPVVLRREFKPDNIPTADADKHARVFIKRRIKDKGERREVYRLFKRLRKRVTEADCEKEDSDD